MAQDVALTISTPFNMAQSTRLIDKASVKAIMNKRTTAPAGLAGRKVTLTIQGNGNVVDVKDKSGAFVQSVVAPGTVFQKKIFNTKTNSGIAMSNVRNNELYIAGKKAEAAGDKEGAHKLYSEFLNKVQLSFNVPTTSPIADQLSSGMDISAVLVKIDTDNGSLLTIDPATIRILEPEMLGTTNFVDDEDLEDAVSVSEVESLKA